MEPVAWETCEIVAHIPPGFFITKLTFRAEAVGVKGRYVADESSPLRIGTTFNVKREPPVGRAVRDTLDALVACLASDGWQSEGRGAEWYSFRFRRPLS